MKNILDWLLSRLPFETNTLLLAIFLLYLGSSFVHLNPEPSEVEGLPHFRLSYLTLAPPRVLSGDSPHYLVSINSLIEDGDFDLSNNYRQAREGDWDAGARFRGAELDHHAEVDLLGREMGTHSPYFALLLAGLSWPVRETAWVESFGIVLTIGAALFGLGILSRSPALDPAPQLRLLILAAASPLWFYSRELWTEPWVMTCWIVLLVVKRPWALFLAGCLGTLIKYPFLVVPLSMGLLEFYVVSRSKGEERKTRIYRGVALCGSAVVGLLLVLALIQWLFREADHFSLFHSGVHASFGIPGWSLVGLWLDPRDGLLFFFPVLLTGVNRWKNWKVLEWMPLLAFFLLHAAYEDWGGGTGFSSRYLVPALPLIVSVVPSATHRIWWRLTFYWSLCWGTIGGLLPALVFDRTPWGVVRHVIVVFSGSG